MPNEKILSEKKAMVQELAEKLKRSSAGVLVDYKGITVAQDTALRVEMRQNNVEYFVIKNTLLRFAAEEAGFPGSDPRVKGNHVDRLVRRRPRCRCKGGRVFLQEGEGTE